jgi:hypothetical protein
MNGQVKSINRQGVTAIKLALSITLLVSMTLSASLLQAKAQAELDQSSLLPPEVVPLQQSSLPYSSVGKSQTSSNSMTAQSAKAVPGLVSNGINAGQAPQSAQDMRNQVFNQLMGQGNYPQLNNQNSVWTNQSGQTGQNTQPAGQSNAAPGQYNQVPAHSNQPLDNSNAPLVQANQTVGQSNWITPDQNNAMANSMPAQTQTLTGGVQNASAKTPSQSGYGFSHAISALSGFGMAAYALGMSRGSGGAYTGSLVGGSMLNYGLRNGFRF